MKFSVKIRIKKFNIFTLFALCFFIGFWLRYFTNTNIIISLAVFFLVSLVSFLYCHSHETNKKIKKVEMILLMVDLIGLFGLLYNHNHTIAELVLMFAWQNMGIMFYAMYKSDNFRLNRNLAIISSVYLSILIYTLHSQFEQGRIIISDRLGANSVSIILLEFFAIDAIYRYKIKKKTNYLFAVFCLLVSVMAGGIAGVLTFSFLLIALLLFEDGKLTVSLVKWIVFAIIVAVILLYSNNVVVKISDYINQGDSESRILMLQQYFSLIKQNVLNFIFGADIHNTYLLQYYKNLHNCFANWHYFYGLIPTIYFLWIVIYIIYRNVKLKNNYYAILIIATLIRSITDETTYAFMPIWIFFFLETVGKNHLLHQTETIYEDFSEGHISSRVQAKTKFFTKKDFAD